MVAREKEKIMEKINKMKSLICTLIILCLLLSIPSSIFAEDKPIQFYLFYSNECDHCEDIRYDLIPYLQLNYKLEVKEFEITDKKNYDLLLHLEKQYKREGNEIPIIFIGDKILSGDEINMELIEILDKYAITGCEYPVLEVSNTPPDTTNESPVIISVSFDTTSKPPDTANIIPDTVDIKPKLIFIAYFYKTGCKHCDRTIYDLRALQQIYPQLVIREYDITLDENTELNEALCQLYNVEEKYHQATPMIFIGEEYLLNDNIKFTSVEPLIKKYLPNGTKIPWNEAKPLLEGASNTIIERFKSFGIFTIVIAGLIDGINPCAFATIIFFVSYLSLIGRKGKEVLLIGGAYTFAVFLTYFLVGLLGLELLDVIKKLRFLPMIIDIIFIITAIFVFVLGMYSLYDFYLFKKGKTSDMILQLPDKMKKQIHKIIRAKSKATHFVLAAFFMGALVSLQELFCTGQVYLPTLIFMTRISQYRSLAILYLLLYNILFILPLVAVFLLVYWGITSKIIAEWMKKHLGAMKILTAILFFTLAIVLIIAVLI